MLQLSGSWPHAPGNLSGVLRYLTAGESHGQALVVIVEGLPAGLEITVEEIQAEMARRRLGYGRGPRQRFEQDELTLLGGALLVVGGMQGQNMWVMLGSGLILLIGVISLLLQSGIINRKVGLLLGAVFGLLALVLAYRNYRSVKEVLEFTAQKRVNDSQVIQALKDIRTAQVGYRQANGVYTGNMEVLRGFVKSGRIPMVRSVGQVPDTLTEAAALELKLIVRDTLLASAMDSLFLAPRVQEGRVYPFDANTFGLSPVTKQPFLLKAGAISSSNRTVPVFIAKDPTPLVAGDTLMVGNMEKQSTAGNWSGE